MHQIIELFPDWNIKWLQIAGSIIEGFRFTKNSNIQHKQRIKTYLVTSIYLGYLCMRTHSEMETFMKFDWHYSVKQWLTLARSYIPNKGRPMTWSQNPGPTKPNQGAYHLWKLSYHYMIKDVENKSICRTVTLCSQSFIQSPPSRYKGLHF